MGPGTTPRLRVVGGQLVTPANTNDSQRELRDVTGADRRLVVAHVLSNLEIGAHAQLALDLARAQRDDGDGVIVISLSSPSPAPMAGDFRAAGIPVYIVPLRGRLDTSLPVRLALLLRRRRVDVIHTHDPLALPYGAVAGRMAGATVVHTERGDRGVTSWPAWFRVRASRLLHGLVSISEQGVRLANAWGVEGRTLLQCVAQAVDLDKFQPDDESRHQVRRQLGLDDNTWVIGTVGHLTKPKEHAMLLRAVAPLLDDDTSLLVVGAGSEQASLRRLADRLKIGNHVRFPGARRDVPRMMAAMDVFALSSRDGILPLVVSEAMAAGLPIVAPAMGSIPDVVVDGEMGHTVRPGDEQALRESLNGLRSARDESKRMGRRARRAARTRFSIHRMNREYTRIYRSLIDAG